MDCTKKVIFVIVLLSFLLVVSVSAAELGETRIYNDTGIETSIDPKITALLYDYFALRNDMLQNKSTTAPAVFCEVITRLAGSKTVTSLMLERFTAAERMAQRHRAHVVTSNITARILSITNSSPSVFEISVYEWTFLHYNDGRGGAIDKMGYQTDHTITIEQLDSGEYVIISLVNDDWMILGEQLTTAMHTVDLWDVVKAPKFESSQPKLPYVCLAAQ